MNIEDIIEKKYNNNLALTIEEAKYVLTNEGNHIFYDGTLLKMAYKTLLTAYEQKCNYIKENEIYKKNLFNSYEEKCKELEKEKEDNKELRKYYATRKEVEELREINKILHDSAENYIHKDKIIAKVIEVKDRPVKDEFITATQGKLDTIIDIESLLGKE